MDTPVRSVEGQVRKRRLNNIETETETSVEDQVRKRRLNNVETETCDRLVLEAILPISLFTTSILSAVLRFAFILAELLAAMIYGQNLSLYYGTFRCNNLREAIALYRLIYMHL